MYLAYLRLFCCCLLALFAVLGVYYQKRAVDEKSFSAEMAAALCWGGLAITAIAAGNLI